MGAPGTGLPQSGVSGHTGEADASGFFSDCVAHKVSVSSSDPKNRLSDASLGGRVCGTAHPTDKHPLTQPGPSAQVRPWGGGADISWVPSNVLCGAGCRD